jgi:hypothetical protein
VSTNRKDEETNPSAVRTIPSAVPTIRSAVPTIPRPVQTIPLAVQTIPLAVQLGVPARPTNGAAEPLKPRAVLAILGDVPIKPRSVLMNLGDVSMKPRAVLTNLGDVPIKPRAVRTIPSAGGSNTRARALRGAFDAIEAGGQRSVGERQEYRASPLGPLLPGPRHPRPDRALLPGPDAASRSNQRDASQAVRHFEPDRGPGL